ncbi:MAG TPA: RNA polymerase sigma factor [Symbiobacteriaceae bacterium]|jgi:RNA polymerase sigma-70 factor (ECF subfamily)
MEEILARLAAGDEMAWEPLMAYWRGRLERYANDYVHNWENAEEIVQDTFVRLWRHAGSVQDSQHLRHWLFRVVGQLCNDRVRTMRRKQGETQTVSLETAAPLPTPQSIEDEVIIREELAEVRRLLTPKEAACLIPIAEGVHFEEVAKRLGIPIGTVKSRVNWARQRLQVRTVPPREKRRKTA